MAENDIPTRREFDRLESKVDLALKLIREMPEKIADRHVSNKTFEDYKILMTEIHTGQNEDINSLKDSRAKFVIFVLGAVGAAIMALVLVQTGAM